MIDLRGYKGFAILHSDMSVEATRLRLYCSVNDVEIIKLKKTDNFPECYIPCGGVEWCESILRYHVIPDYYPEWASQFLYRKVWREDEWILGKKLFVKPADRYKRFTGFVTTGTYRKKKRGQLIWSEIVNFTNEWRYYISYGKVLCSGWYSGDESEPCAPELTIEIPEEYCGALDFGTLSTGEFALVESQHPFACGWYGSKDQDELYFQWLIDGWIYMKTKTCIS